MKLAFVLAGLAFASSAAMAASNTHEMSGSMSMNMDHANHQNSTGAAVSSTLTVTDCWIRALPEPAPSAGYFVVHNSGNTAVKLKSASSKAYGSVMLHQTTHDSGMSKMSMAHDIAIPANGTLAFKPGSFHAMLEKASKPVVVGTSVPMEFMFDSGEKAQAMCEVKPANTLAQ